MAIYLGSDTPIPRQAWDRDNPPPICVLDLQEKDRAVRRHFSKPHVCYVGAYEGCGCGFELQEEVYEYEPDELNAKRQSRAGLAALLRRTLQTDESLELYACWEGEQDCDPEHRGVLVPEDLLSPSMTFRECEFLIVTTTR